MDFPITELLNHKASESWILAHFHPNGLRCRHCQAGLEQANEFRTTKRSQLTVYRCKRCQGTYNLYSDTVFEGRHLPPEKVVLFLRGVAQGQSSAQLARELCMSRTTVIDIRHDLQANAEKAQPDTPLTDLEVETDEMFQNSGEKRRLAW